MTNEPIGAGDLTNPDDALHHEAEQIASRYPDATVDDVEHRLHETYDALDEQATVKSHLVTIAVSEVAADLRAESALIDDNVVVHSETSF
jgi:hypothetical protein